MLMSVNRAQQVVVVIALGLVLLVVGASAVALLLVEPVPDGWFSYEPGLAPGTTDDYFVVRDLELGDVLPAAAVAIAAIVLWAGASTRVLRDRPSTGAATTPAGDPDA